MSSSSSSSGDGSPIPPTTPSSGENCGNGNNNTDIVNGSHADNDDGNKNDIAPVVSPPDQKESPIMPLSPHEISAAAATTISPTTTNKPPTDEEEAVVVGSTNSRTITTTTSCSLFDNGENTLEEAFALIQKETICKSKSKNIIMATTTIIMTTMMTTPVGKLVLPIVKHKPFCTIWP
jgi:hypothetical protein